MSLTTVEVELDHGMIKAKDGSVLPDHAEALLTLLPRSSPTADPLARHPELGRAVFHEDPAKPLSPGDWPEAFA